MCWPNVIHNKHLIDQTKLLFWNKMYITSNVRNIVLATFLLSRFMSGASRYGVFSPLQHNTHDQICCTCTSLKQRFYIHCVQKKHPLTFLRASAMLKHVIDIGWTSVCPSVTRWHPIKTAEYIVMTSSPHDSPFILVLCTPRSSRNSDGVTLCGGAKYRWGIKICAIFYQ